VNKDSSTTEWGTIKLR